MTADLQITAKAAARRCAVCTLFSFSRPHAGRNASIQGEAPWQE